MYDDLMTLAVQIATLDSRRPKQANLRRAVSTAYYAIFTFLLTRRAACSSVHSTLTERIGMCLGGHSRTRL